ncbi:MAG: retroviral-like aspartic protease family protein [Candidatus Binatia bacterium]
MGKTHARVKVSGTNGRRARAFQAKFLVDTGATDCLVPASKLRRIGIRVRGRDTYELADGSRREYDIGIAEFEIDGRVTAGRIRFGPEAAEPILGLTVLESLGLVVDPRRRALRRGPAIALK